MSAVISTLRIARRDAARAKGRSALVVAMIALPILGVGAADVLWRTFQLSPEQKAARELGAADAVLDDVGMPGFRQDANGSATDMEGATERRGPGVAPAALLPPGSRLVSDASTEADVTGGDRTTHGELRALDYLDPVARGIYQPIAGRAPHDGEVSLTPAFARQLGVGLGDMVRVSGLPGRHRVVGLVEDGSRTNAVTALVPSDTVHPDFGERTYLVHASRPLTWRDVERANALGFAVRPRGRLAGSPPPPATPQPLGDYLTAAVLVAGMVVLEIVLLAGPAFAVGTKRQSRDLALLAATGGDARDVRRVVLGGGLVLGVAGGTAGVLAGIGVAWMALPHLADRSGQVPGPFDVRPQDLAVVALLGVGTALLAAVVPALNAARQDVRAALTGRRGQPPPKRRTPALGAVATVCGALLALHGASRRDVNLVLAGSVVAELGLVAATPFLVGAVGRLSPWLPLGPRLALRDAARNRSRTAPAVAAVLAAVAGSTAIGTYLASMDRYQQRSYQPNAPMGTVSVPLEGQSQRPLAGEVAAALRKALPWARVMTIEAVDGSTGAPPRYVVVTRPAEPVCKALSESTPTREQLLAARRNPVCHGRSVDHAFTGHQLVGGPDLLAAVTGARGPQYDRVLRSGGMVAGTEEVSSQGKAEVQVQLLGPGEQQRPAGPPVRLPAVALPAHGIQAQVLSPAAAARLGLPVVPVGVLAVGDRPPTSAEEDRARKALQVLGIRPVLVERGPEPRSEAGLLALLVGSAVIVLGASGVATGLAAAEGRPDLATLAAVGASPRTRRRLAAFQSAVIAVLGSLLGVAAGLVPALGMVRALNAAAGQEPIPRLDPYPIVLPWTNLVVTLIAVPLLAALAAGLLSRSRLPMVRRIG